MDYKNKYIKYKTKYLELKNMDINNQIGGNYNMQNSDIKLITKIGEGWSGSVYKCKIGNTNGIYKIEKINNYDLLDNNSNYHRQIDFSINVGNKYPNKFLLLAQNGILHNCSYTSNIPSNMQEYLKKEKRKSNKIKTCAFLIYTPILDGTLRHIIDKLSNIEYKNMVKQIINSINIIHKNGYMHRDIHDENIMYKKINGAYKWYIIDYGLIFNEKYKLNDTDIIVNKKYWKNDKIAFIYSILNKKILDVVEEKKIIIKNFDERVKYIKNNLILKNIKKYISSNLSKNETNEIIIILIIILHNNIFIESLGLDYQKYIEYDIEQRDNNFLLNIIKNI